MTYFAPYLDYDRQGNPKPFSLIRSDDFQAVLTGTDGRDVLIGKGSLNHFRGDPNGIAAHDVLVGGDGVDVFFFGALPSRPSQADTILNYDPSGPRPGEGGDFIDLSQIFPDAAHGELSADAFRKGKVAKDAEDRVLYDRKTGAVRIDVDGAEGEKAIKLCVLADKPKIDHDDFVI